MPGLLHNLYRHDNQTVPAQNRSVQVVIEIYSAVIEIYSAVIEIYSAVNEIYWAVIEICLRNQYNMSNIHPDASDASIPCKVCTYCF